MPVEERRELIHGSLTVILTPRITCSEAPTVGALGDAAQ